MSAGAVRIVRDPFITQVFAPFEAKDLIKTLPYGTRKWDQASRCWLVDTSAVSTLIGLLKAADYQVVEPGKTRSSDSSSRVVRPAKSGTWADEMFAALAPAQAARAYKALARALHPDLGGDGAAMQQLNAARDRAGRA